MNTITELTDYVRMNVNLKEFMIREYGFEFGTGSMACCKLNAHGGTDDTPSFMYYAETNSFFCHGCKTGGNIIDLVADQEGLDKKGQDFIQILKIICEKENIKFNFDNEKPVDPRIAQELDRRTQLAIKYRKQLWEAKDSEAFQYLISRGFTEQTIKNFNIGVTSPNESRVGLANISNRIAFPIINSAGNKVLAFSFRTLEDTKDRKYINYATDEIFHKGSVFYGWSQAIKHIREKKHAYIVEGYCDMISMFQVGLKNTLACMTNRMTEDQISILARTVKKITIIIDQDEAGEKGFNETILTMLEYGLEVNIVTHLNYKGKDMNDVCIKLGWDKDKVEALLIQNSVDGVMYKLRQALDKFDEKTLKLVESVLRISNVMIDSVQDNVKRDVYREFVNKRLGLR